MKKIIYALMLVLGMSVLASCQKEGNGGSASIVGTWKLVSVLGPFGYDDAENGYLQFKKNGTCVIVNPDADFDKTVTATWRLSDDTLTLEGDGLTLEGGFPPIFTVRELTKNSMTVATYMGLIEYELKRVSDSEIEKYL